MEADGPRLEWFMLERLTLQHFESGIAGDFAVQGFEGLILVLREARVSDASRHAGREGVGRSEPFELMFEGPKSPVLPQKIYRLESAFMEPLEIFIVPIGPYGSGIGYQAIFN